MTKQEFVDEFLADKILTERDADRMYREFLDESGPVTVCGMSYDVSAVLEAVDSVAYRCGFSDFMADEHEEHADGYVLRADLEEAAEAWEESQDDEE